MINRFKPTAKKHKERGVALIIVISMMAVMLLVAFGISSDSAVSELSGGTLAARGNMKYEAESKISRSLWCYLWDRKKYLSSHRRLGRELEERPEEDGRPWLANGMPRLFINKESNCHVSVKIHDAIQGTDIDQSNRPGMNIRKQRKTNEIEDEYLRERIERFTYALDDYVDYNEYHSHPDYHYEMDDYEEQFGIYDFPANNRLQVREEVYWLPEVDVMAAGDVGKITKTFFRVVSPRRWKKGPDQAGSIYSSKSTKASLFSTSSQQIQQEQDIDDELMQEVEELKSGTVFWDEVSDEAKSILNNYSRDESGICTIEATGIMYNGEMTRTMKATFDCNVILNNKRFFNCWEQIIY